MKNEMKKIYSSPEVSLVQALDEDVISTSSFEGEDHVFGVQKSSSENYEL